MNNFFKNIEYCGFELKNAVKYLEQELKNVIKESRNKQDIDIILGYVEEFYIMFELENNITDDFIEEVKKMDAYNITWLFEDSHKLYYLSKMGLGRYEFFQDAFDEFIKNEQRLSGYIHSNNYDHVGPMRVLIEIEPKSEYTKLAVKYFIENYNPKEYVENAIGILSLFEYNYYDYEELLQRYANDLKEGFGINGCIKCDYKQEINTALAVQAIGAVCGREDPIVESGIQWIKTRLSSDNYTELKWYMGECLLSLISAGDGIKIPLVDLKKNKLLNNQKNNNSEIKNIDTNKIYSYNEVDLTLDRIMSRFHIAANQMKNRYSSRDKFNIRDEYDVQDLLHAFLKLAYDDIRVEEYTPSYAGKSSRVDFLLKRESTVIEVKKTRIGLGAKEIGDQLIIDIERYKTHPDCKKLYCFIYDPEYIIENPNGLENDLSFNNNYLEIITKVIPKGL